MSSTTLKSPSRHAHFSSNAGQDKERREKILTIRYGKNQMALIRKRLKVEMWLYDSLEMLSCQQGQTQNVQQGDLCENGEKISNKSAEIDIEIDQILDLETECERRQWLQHFVVLQDKLEVCTVKRDVVQKFIDDFLEKLKTL